MTFLRHRFRLFSRLSPAFLIAVAAMLFSAPALAALQAHVDRNPVALNESFNLVLENNDNHGGNPQLDVLMRDFEILGQSTSNSVEIVNGTAMQSVKWQISLMAKHKGQLEIPPITLGRQTSQAININVEDAQGQGNQMFLEVAVKPQVIHVQQQVILTVHLYFDSSIEVQKPSLSELKFPNMDGQIQRLDKSKTVEVTRNGKAYQMLELHYAIFPQKEGQFSNDPLLFDGEVVDQNQRNGFFGGFPFVHSAHHVLLRSNVVNLTVTPTPANYGGAQWLPANNVKLEERWSSNPATFTVGEPITRTLIETADGLPASQLPSLDSGANMDGFKRYPDQPQLKDDKSDTGIVGRREQKIAYIPTQPGKLVLPAIKVTWWNTKLNKEEVASLPEQSITVLPGKQDQSGGLPSSAANPQASTNAAPVANSNEVTTGNNASNKTSAGWWPFLSLFLAFGWILTLCAWWWRVRKPVTVTTQPPHAHDDSLKNLERQLKQSCLENDPVQTKTILLKLAKQRWSAYSPVSLTALARHYPDELARQLIELDRLLYTSEKVEWQGEQLWRLYTTRQSMGDVKSKEHASALADLYP